jgi:hypothetical protein
MLKVVTNVTLLISVNCNWVDTLTQNIFALYYNLQPHQGELNYHTVSGKSSLLCQNAVYLDEVGLQKLP